MSRTNDQRTYSRRKIEALRLVESLAKDAGYHVVGNDKSGIDEFLEDVKSGKTKIKTDPYAENREYVEEYDIPY